MQLTTPSPEPQPYWVKYTFRDLRIVMYCWYDNITYELQYCDIYGPYGSTEDPSDPSISIQNSTFLTRIVPSAGTNITDDTTTNDTRINDRITALGEQPQPYECTAAKCYCFDDIDCFDLERSPECTGPVRDSRDRPGLRECDRLASNNTMQLTTTPPLSDNRTVSLMEELPETAAAPPPLTATDCYYRGDRYSTGSVVRHANGILYECLDGIWNEFYGEP